jgi:hypothetical protein
VFNESVEAKLNFTLLLLILSYELFLLIGEIEDYLDF